MHILIVARGYPTKKYKMNGIFEFDQAKALAKAGCKVVYAAVDVRSIRRWRKWGIEYHKIDGVDVYAINIPGGRIPKFILQKLSVFGLNVLYKKIIKEHGRPDIIHAHFAGIGYTASKLKQQTNIPLVITEHFSSLMKPTIDKQLFNVANTAYKHADAVIAVSPALASVINNRFLVKTIYIPNIVDVEIFKYSTRTNNGKFEFISVGNLIPRKRMDLTIEAFYRAFKDNDEVFLTICGEGPERKRLEELIKEYELNRRVKLMGMCSRKDIAEYLKKCDCFVLASCAETFGVVYIEALASGIPVIATKCGGPEGFVNENNGIKVSVDNVDELTKAMLYMYNNSDKYDKEIISQQIKQDFSPEKIAKQLMQIYEKVKNMSGKGH